MTFRFSSTPIAASLLLFVSPALFAQRGDVVRAADPTKPTPAFADELRESVASVTSLRLRALVVGAEEEGVALVGTDKYHGTPLRAGSSILQDIAGIPVPLKIRSVTADGVEIEAGKEEAASFHLPGAFKVLPVQPGADPTLLRYLECSEIPLEVLIRLIADQTGVNISTSAQTAQTPVSIFLRNVPAAVAVEEICRATGLWYRRDEASGIVRVTTLSEYEQGLASFREEQTETFTLLYPNVLEVASIIYGIYPERVLLSLGDDDLLDDEKNDISRRLDRFNAIADAGGSSFLKIDAPSTSGGSSSGAGGFLRPRSEVEALANGISAVGYGRGGKTALSAAEAKQLTPSGGATNEAARLAEAYRGRAASIFVTISRRNNMIVVRTSDSRAMSDIRALVKRLDVPTPMVLLEVRVMELQVDDDFTSSFEYSFVKDRNTTSANPGDRLDAGNAYDSRMTRTSGGFPGFNPLANEPRTDSMSFQILDRHLQMRVQMLEKDGKVKTLATPTLLTANNEVSRLFIGEERPMVRNITSQTIVSENSTVTVPQTEIEFAEVGTLLLITPNINADRTVTLRLVQENSEISENAASIPVYSLGGGGVTENVAVDVVSSRSITGTFVARDEMTIAVGGLVKEVESEVVRRVPFLGRLPLIGFLFRSTEKVRQRTELIVAIKPHVISTPADGEAISRRVLDGIAAHPARDGRPTLGLHKPPSEEAGEKAAAEAAERPEAAEGEEAQAK